MLALFVAAPLSIAYPFIAYYLWREWEELNGTVADDYADRCLYGAIALTLFIFLEKFLIKALLSKGRPGEDKPHLFDTTKRDSIQRPDGTVSNIENYGKEDGQSILIIAAKKDRLTRPVASQYMK